jgi:hypothetical protein
VCNLASPNPFANHSTIPVRNDAACAIDHTMNKDASIGEIQGLLLPPSPLHNIPTIVDAIRIGTIVILKLNRNLTISLASPFSSGSLVKFWMITLFDKDATIVYDIAKEMNAIATNTSCDSTKNNRIIEINAIIMMCGKVLGESMFLIN